MPMADQWKAAKQTFENTTKTKKPSTKVLGVFRMGTGIEAVLKKIDAVLATKVTADEKFKKAGPMKTEFDKVSAAYQGKLNTTIAGEKAAIDPVYKKAAEKLKFDLHAIGISITDTLKKLLDENKKK
jgi:hypothetical protein